MRTFMLDLQAINPIWIRGIKIVSVIVIVGAMIVDGAIAYRWMQGIEITRGYAVMGAIGSVALGAHFIESVIASVMAFRKGLDPLRFWIYTFFVGTVAFFDLLGSE